MWQQPRAAGRPLRWRQQLGQGPLCLVLTMVLVMQLERSDTTGCEMGKYRNGTECCPTCAVGANLVTAAACTYTKNTVCGCRPGHFCSSPGPEVCAVCQPYTVCVPGTMVKEWGTATKDHVCEVCPPGTNSTANMSVACTQWPRLKEQDPSPALPEPAVIAILVSVVIVVAVVAAITHTCQRRKMRSRVPSVQESEHEQRGQALRSMEEKGAQTTVPVQEVGADPEETKPESESLV
ncbi:tumor necrosis factor receptor superfamily member 14-like isoform X1 [Pipra filicauda]|uniref:Tumor necrosis factor receptor superfamily member 14-like isoform X1 n=1 Tax=Pipra filicauda TaxID=649802 RepID=A0A7R5L7I2_9PASS|nr:tumor necrosis factor receptor superfamily member 14-like isoform X1 [Pipra filicauda]